uniref:Uncharacterized protein n=1 Tax=Meloidogyne enterolobii TaxID=390850 RepID=A0A6V7WG22_MELEN|nr:unnamed protein product [Meloidogyne enterolobii]
MLKYLSIFICIFNFVLIQAILNTNLNNRLFALQKWLGDLIL